MKLMWITWINGMILFQDITNNFLLQNTLSRKNYGIHWQKKKEDRKKERKKKR